jgi:hypothetical protein
MFLRNGGKFLEILRLHIPEESTFRSHRCRNLPFNFLVTYAFHSLCILSLSQPLGPLSSSLHLTLNKYSL